MIPSDYETIHKSAELDNPEWVSNPHIPFGYQEYEDGRSAADRYRVHWEGEIPENNPLRELVSIAPDWIPIEWKVKGDLYVWIQNQAKGLTIADQAELHMSDTYTIYSKGREVARFNSLPPIDTGIYPMNVALLAEALGFLQQGRQNFTVKFSLVSKLEKPENESSFYKLSSKARNAAFAPLLALDGRRT